MIFSSVEDRTVAVVPIGHNLRLELRICNDGVAPVPMVTAPTAIPGTSFPFDPFCTRAPAILYTWCPQSIVHAREAGPKLTSSKHTASMRRLLRAGIHPSTTIPVPALM
jgi:hypothetical protein